mgnify:CR=1 FL=1
MQRAGIAEESLFQGLAFPQNVRRLSENIAKGTGTGLGDNFQADLVKLGTPKAVLPN